MPAEKNTSFFPFLTNSARVSSDRTQDGHHHTKRAPEVRQQPRHRLSSKQITLCSDGATQAVKRKGKEGRAQQVRTSCMACNQRHCKRGQPRLGLHRVLCGWTFGERIPRRCVDVHFFYFFNQSIHTLSLCTLELGLVSTAREPTHPEHTHAHAFAMSAPLLMRRVGRIRWEAAEAMQRAAVEERRKKNKGDASSIQTAATAAAAAQTNVDEVILCEHDPV